MTDKPILFSGPMVRALLDGHKMQTRRVVKPQPPAEATSAGNYSNTEEGITNRWTWLSGDPTDADTWGALDDFTLRFCVGDRLYVRETLAKQESPSGVEFPGYAVDGKHIEHTSAGWPFRRDSVPSIHMPRWASRLTLHVTEVRVEQLQAISAADAIAEGIRPDANSLTIDNDTPDPRHAFRSLWESINGAGSWAANPWVVAVSFDVEHANIDSARKASAVHG